MKHWTRSLEVGIFYFEYVHEAITSPHTPLKTHDLAPSRLDLQRNLKSENTSKVSWKAIWCRLRALAPATTPWARTSVRFSHPHLKDRTPDRPLLFTPSHSNCVVVFIHCHLSNIIDQNRKCVHVGGHTNRHTNISL